MGSTIIDVGEFIRREGPKILARWEQRARKAPVAREQSTVVLIDSLPQLLERIAENAAKERNARSPASVSRRHAVERLEQGYDLGEVVEEYTLLRECIFERMRELDLLIDPDATIILNHAVDDALRETTRRFTEANERMLRGLDRISTAPLGQQSVESVLNEILRALKETAGADVDSVSLFLVADDGRLRNVASIGLEDEVKDSFSVAIGEGFIGTVAATARPLLLRDAAHDKLVISPVIRKRGIRGLYGVPLMDEGRVIGAAHIGSRQASEFAEEDLMLFRAMANRASGIIVRAQFVAALQKTARFREQFIGILAHDLRNPLNAILLGAHGLVAGKDAISPVQVARASERIVRSATRMNALIDDILDFTRARLGGGLPVTPTRTSLRDVAREVVDELAARASEREIAVDAPEDVVGRWDRNRLAQVLSNLVGNAIDHGRPGTPITVSIRSDERCALAMVHSAGTPIPQQLREKLFEPFERTTTSGGLGLGLYISREIVTAHGGRLTVTPDASGNTFIVQLPCDGGAPGALSSM